MKFTVFIVLILVCMELSPSSGWFWRRKSKKSKSKTTVDVGVSANNKGHKATIGVSHQSGSVSGGISGSIDSNDGWSAQAGIKIKFRKRSIDWNGHHYTIKFTVDQCNFNVYDEDRDGFITKKDIEDIFGEGKETDNLLNDLDITTGDGKLDEEEFNLMAPFMINGCEKVDMSNNI